MDRGGVAGAELAAMAGRTGARTIAQIPPAVLQALNGGHIPTANLNEFLAIDLATLTRAVAGHIGLAPDAEMLQDTLAMLGAFKPMRRHLHVARTLYNLTEQHPLRDAVADALARHPSDVARAWAAQWVAFSGLALPQKLLAVQRFAADGHFGVREMAWMAVRDAVIDELDLALGLLQDWTASDDANLRRFASELTRPRGVWCAQIEALKSEPWRGLALLEPLKADPSRYVQNSVANWLNDAAKTHPEWVSQVCDRWVGESPSRATAYIVRRACRSLPDDQA